MQLHIALLKLNVLLIVNENALGNIFTIVPTTQYVFVGRIATFECAADNGTLILSVSGVTGIVSDPIDLPGGGQLRTATFTVTAANNGSAEVICLVKPEGGTFVSSDAVTAYAQVPNPPTDLSSNQEDSCTIIIQWKEPFLLPGLSVSYTVSVYLVDTVSVHNVSTTTFTYHPTTGGGVYTIQVTAFNDTLTSDTTNTTVEYDNGNQVYVIYNNRDTTTSNQIIWKYRLKLMAICRLNHTTTSCNIMVTSCTDDNTCYNTSNVTMDDNEMIDATYADLPDDTIFTTGILVEYESGQILNSTNEVITSTYSLQDVALLNTTNNTVCVEYYLVKGTDEHIVDATIRSDSLGVQALPAINIEASTEVCYSDIAANTWTLYGCDGGSTSCNSSNAAVSITGIVVTGISTSATPTLTSTTSNGILPTVSVSVSSTIILSPEISSAVPLVSVVVPVVAVICIVLCIIISIIILGIIIKVKQNKKAFPNNDIDVRVNRDRIDSGAGLLDNIVFDSKPPPNNANYTDVILTDAQPPQQTTLLYADIGIKPSINPISQDDDVQYAGIQGTAYSKCPETLQSKTIDHPPTHTELIAVLVPRLSAKWHAIGVGLGLTPQQLEEVQGNRPDDRDGCLKDVLMMWEDNPTDDKPYTWATMLHVLRSGKIGEEGLVNYLQQVFML